jgi:hypothetical protein
MTNTNMLSIEDAINDAANAGAQEGSAQNVKHELMIRLASHANAGVISTDIKSADMSRFASAYFQGKNQSTFSNSKKDISEGTFKKTVAQFRAVALCGQHATGAGVEVLETTLAIAASLREREDGFNKSLFQSVVDVAVKQNKVEAPLTAEEIKDILNPTKEEEAYSLAKRVEAVAKTVKNLIEGTTDADGNVIKPEAKTICPIASQRLEAALSAALLALEAANAAEGITPKV